MLRSRPELILVPPKLRGVKPDGREELARAIGTQSCWTLLQQRVDVSNLCGYWRAGIRSWKRSGSIHDHVHSVDATVPLHALRQYQ
jgi:hypothetical protein